jgi:hypothetical protein
LKIEHLGLNTFYFTIHHSPLTTHQLTMKIVPLAR